MLNGPQSLPDCHAEYITLHSQFSLFHFGMKTFAVVEFLIDHGVSALPTKWINNLDPDRKSGSVFWPPEEDDKVKSGSELLKIKPQADWRLLEVRFLVSLVS